MINKRRQAVKLSLKLTFFYLPATFDTIDHEIVLVCSITNVDITANVLSLFRSYIKIVSAEFCNGIFYNATKADTDFRALFEKRGRKNPPSVCVGLGTSLP